MTRDKKQLFKFEKNTQALKNLYNFTAIAVSLNNKKTQQKFFNCLCNRY